MPRKRWAVMSGPAVCRLYQAKSRHWTRDITDVRWFSSKNAAERSFDHSQWVVVPESAVVKDMVESVLEGS